MMYSSTTPPLHKATIGLLASAAVALVCTFTVASGAPAFGQDQMRLGPRQFERDRGGGAVLCAWSLYLAFQAESAACKVPRQPIDDAIDEAIIAMDEFIIANSSLRPTREMLETFKQRVVDQDLNAMRARGLEKVCAGGDLQVFCSISPDQMRTQTKALLAIPREPVMNPCL